MIPREILKKVRTIEIKTRGLVNEIFSGEYHSAFKGRGMEFAEVREYQYGDEIRKIDWNVSARARKTFIKTFEEERELTVLLVVDISPSSQFGAKGRIKGEIAVELAAIVAFSAIKNNDKVGLILFTDQIEKFVSPRKGRSHVLRIIREVLSFQPEGNKTDLKGALEYFNHTIKKKSITFLISDFIDEGYEKIIKIIGKKHDFVSIILQDPREREIPKAGLIKIQDSETGSIRYLDSSSKIVQDYFNQKIKSNDDKIKDLFMRSRIDSIKIDTSKSYIKPLVDFFKVREKRW
ncbi:MAG: DUF58 domain-containing protein [Melioribacteraceae bacterium]|nr:DUF58 domain-containing protein [Melioribacteraceae bacterium]